MKELEIKLVYDAESGTWDACAVNVESGLVDYDTGPARPKTPEAALIVLAQTLYRLLDEADA